MKTKKRNHHSIIELETINTVYINLMKSHYQEGYHQVLFSLIVDGEKCSIV